jgi:hypothetical protein
MTVMAPLKQQQRNVLEYLTTVYEADLRSEAAPSLLPESAQKSQAAERIEAQGVCHGYPPWASGEHNLPFVRIY